MSQATPDDTALLPSESERQKIFHWLKKLSSVTAWRRIFQFYETWAAVAEISMQGAELRGWSKQTALPQSEYLHILKHLAHCEEGVRRLGRGDKRVFKFDANGEFVMANRILSHWSKKNTLIELGEISIDEQHTPEWQEFLVALKNTCQAWGECASKIIEPRYLEDPGLTMYGRWLKKELLTMPFPDYLVPVPDPIENVFIRTNEWTPCSGIWEPIHESSSTEMSILNLFSRRAKPQPPFKIIGTMNYLHGGSKAPQIRVQTTKDTYRLDTTWRLLWRDDRYIDGTVPEEEDHYRFTTPKEIPPHNWIVTDEKAREWAENVGTGAITPPPASVAGGGICVTAGYYFTPVKLDSRRFFNQGDQFPDFDSSIGNTFWQWTIDQIE